MKIDKYTLLISDKAINREFTAYLSKKAVKRMPLAIGGMLIYLVLTIKGVYDCGLDSEMPFAKYTRVNFVSALINSVVLIYAHFFISRTKKNYLVGTLAAIFYVFMTCQISTAVYLHEMMRIERGLLYSREFNLLVFLFQLLAFQIFQSFFNVNYAAAQYLVIPSFFINVCIVHAWIIPHMPSGMLPIMLTIIFIYCVLMWVGTYDFYTQNIELFLSRHFMRQQTDSFRKVLNAQDTGISVIMADERDETLSLKYSNAKFDQIVGGEKMEDLLNQPLFEEVDCEGESPPLASLADIWR